MKTVYKVLFFVSTYISFHWDSCFGNLLQYSVSLDQARNYEHAKELCTKYKNRNLTIIQTTLLPRILKQTILQNFQGKFQFVRYKFSTTHTKHLY